MKNQKRKDFFVTFDGRINATVKENLRQKVTPLSFNEVRRCRIPFHEALLAELSDGHFINAFDFFKELTESDFKQGSVLIRDESMMELIFDKVKQTECDSKENEIEILVRLGKDIEDKKDIRLNWMVDKIYSRALAKVENYQFEGSRLDAVTKYFYGKFLSGIDEKLQEAVGFLEQALDISYGVDEWGIELQPLFNLISIDLSKSMIKLSIHVRKENPEKSLELAEKAVKVVRKIRNNKEAGPLEIHAEIEIGNSLLSLGHLSKALRHFEFASEIAKYRKFPETTLHAMLKMSECLKGDDTQHEKILNEAKVYSKLHMLIDSEADIMVTLGQFLTDRKKYDEALNCFNEALSVYEKSLEMKKLQRVRILMAPLRGT